MGLKSETKERNIRQSNNTMLAFLEIFSLSCFSYVEYKLNVALAANEKIGFKDHVRNGFM